MLEDTERSSSHVQPPYMLLKGSQRPGGRGAWQPLTVSAENSPDRASLVKEEEGGRAPHWPRLHPRPVPHRTQGTHRAPTSPPTASVSEACGCCLPEASLPSFRADLRCFSISATCFRSCKTSRCTWSSSWGSSRWMVSMSRGSRSTWEAVLETMLGRWPTLGRGLEQICREDTEAREGQQ